MNFNLINKTILFILIAFVTIQPGFAKQKRVALVIGNSTYKSLPSLKNPSNDAKDIAKQLKKNGFQVTRLINANQRSMDKAIRKFSQQLNNKNTVGLFYFAGHGVQVKNRNYLIPLSSGIQNEADVAYSAIGVGWLLAQIERADNDFNLVILDACRDNPFPGGSFRSATRGLAKADNLPKGSMILYAASPGQKAEDGSGRNGLFTSKLLKAIKVPGLTVDEVINQTAREVYKSASDGQLPYKEGIILNNFYFNDKVIINQPRVQVAGGEAISNKNRQEISFWESIDKTPSVAGYKIYLQQYPKGLYKSVANYKINLLLKKQAKLSQTKPKPMVTQAKLTIRSNLNGDKVMINGEDKGSTRLDVNLKPGIYEIEVSKVGYNLWERSIKIVAGIDQTIYAKLSRIKSVEPAYQPSLKAQPKSIQSNLSQYGINMVSISGGRFQMGSPSREEGRESDEKQHSIYVDDFKINKTEVTLKAFRQFVNATGYTTDAEKDSGGKKGCISLKDNKWQWVDGRDFSNPGFNQQSNHPVVCVSHNDAMAYIKWLNRKTGKTFRLPTEAEWEYAVRGGKGTARFWGNNPDDACRYANVADKNNDDGVNWSTKHNCNDGFNISTAPVGNYKSNPFGLKDMLGNVWEWTCSKGQKKYSGQEKRCSQSATVFALRGGSWVNIPSWVRSANRARSKVFRRLSNIGFRLVQVR